MRKFSNKIEMNSIRYGLWNLGYADKEIASILNIPRQTISGWRRRRNLIPNYTDNFRDSLGRFIKGVKWSYWENRKPQPTGVKYTIRVQNQGWFKKGMESWNKGISHSEESKKKMSDSKKGKHLSPKTEFKKGNNIGLTNPNWKGGITPLCKSIRQIPEFIQWREKVFTRDDYTCQECMKRGITIHAHHKTQFNVIMNEFDIKSINNAINCKLLWDIENGTTLCEECHKKYHSRNNRKI